MKKNILFYCFSCFFPFIILYSSPSFAQKPVTSAHPRIFLDATTKASLLTKKSINDPDWIALKAEADKYTTGTVIPWDVNSASSNAYYGTSSIFYSYCGSEWEAAAMALGMAHQLTKTNNPGINKTAYSDKLMQFADVIIAAYAAYPPKANNNGANIFQFNSAYATRHVGKAIGIIYDWCYDELGPTRKAALIHVMEDWFDYMRDPNHGVNQIQYGTTGNYYIGHLVCAAYMGYAIAGDSHSKNGSTYSQQMIDFARARVLGTQSGSLSPSDLPFNYFKQSFTGGLPSAASAPQSYLGPHTYLAAPQKDGIPVQGWSYGGESNNFLIDYCFLVKSSTTEVIADSLRSYFDKSSEALVHAYTPNRFQYDNSNDNGSFLGCVAAYALPLRLAAISEGHPAGPKIQEFYTNWIKPVNLAGSSLGYFELNWEKLLYKNTTRPSALFNYPPYYPIPSQNLFSAVPINSGLHKFYMRTNWSDTATWCTMDLGAGVYDQHNHNNAGHFKIIRGDAHDGDDHLLVGANEVGQGTGFGQNGISGGTTYTYANSYSNTLFIDDGNDYDNPLHSDNATHAGMRGGQTAYGYDEPTHEEQNDIFSYFRTDLTSAYFVSYSNPDTSQRTLRYYYRSFLYLRNSNIFVVYDKFLAKNNPSNQYPKHLRWHFMESPIVSGNNITATMDNSKLYVHTVLPAAVTIAKVNEHIDLDPLVTKTYTWRAEVSVYGNPIKQDILTVMQPGGLASTEMVTTAITTNENNMEGSIVQVNGNTEVVLFNNSTAKYPPPITMASYSFNGPVNTQHSLCGLGPNKVYQVDYNSSTVTVTQSASGNLTASPSGVLNFQMGNGTVIIPPVIPPVVPPITDKTKSTYEVDVYPNPSTGLITLNLLNPPKEKLLVEVFDITGKKVISLNIDSKGTLYKEAYDWTGLQKGAYVVAISSITTFRTVKMIIQ